LLCVYKPRRERSEAASHMWLLRSAPRVPAHGCLQGAGTVGRA